MTRDRIAVIELEDGSDLVVSIDQLGRVDVREWTQTGDLKFPSKHGVACPRSALTALIDALRKAKRREAA